MAYLGNAPARSFISFERQVFTIVNSQTAYTLSHSVTNENDIRLVVNNVVQEPGSGKAYTATGTALTLSAALTNGTDEMYCVFLGRATATNAPGAGSVGTSQLASDSVTLAKMASGTDGNIISYDASGNPVAVATGSAAQVLTSAGAGAVPSFQTATVPDDAITLAKMAPGTDGNIISYDASGNPVAVATGSAGQVLTSAGAGAPPTFATGGISGWSSSSGNLLPADASKGIYLGVNSATAANLLDDYEEGTWDASIACGSGSITLNSSYNTCKYTKIGRSVLLSGSLTVSSVSSPSGDLLINGMPFSSGSGEGGERATGAFCMYNPTNGTPPGLICQIFGGYASIRVESSGSADRSQADHPQASSELRFTINYQIGN